MPKLQLCLGVDSFAEIRSNVNYLYVDKSMLVKAFIESIAEGEGAVASTSKASLILRPRRFGKTLNLSMLCEFFSNRRGGAPNLFTGLKISEDVSFCTAYQNKYPVIFISLKGLETLSLDALLSAVNNLVAHLFSSFTAECRAVIQQFRESHVDVTKIELDFTVLVEGRAGQQQLETSLKFLCRCLELYYNQKVIILIDEYDAVLNFVWRNYCGKKIDVHKCGRELSREEQENWLGRIREINTFIRHFLGSALKGNDHLFKGLMTGIYPMAKRDSASDLNNVQVYSLLDSEFSQFFGFTEDELNWVLASVESRMDPNELKGWYNGYQGGVDTSTRLYNPWSVLTCLKRNKVKAYWEETGNHDLIHDHVLEDQDEAFKEAVARLAQGETAECRLNTFINFEQEEKGYESVMTTLFYTGYLTVVEEVKISKHTYLVRAPNQEIVDVYEEVIQEWLKTKLPPTRYEAFLVNLLRGDVESFARELNDFLLQSISVFDATVESNYSMFMAGLLIALHNAYAIQFNNIESGHGRPDGLILPKDSRYHCGFILEYKHLREAEVPLRRKNDKAYLEQKLKSSALEGFEQIDSHRYDAHVRAFPHVKQILQVSLAFYKKRVVIVSQRKILETMSPGEIELYLPNKPKRIIATPETTETRAEVVPIGSVASFFHEHETRAQSRKRTAEQAEISRELEEGAPATKMVHGGKAV